MEIHHKYPIGLLNQITSNYNGSAMNIDQANQLTLLININ